MISAPRNRYLKEYFETRKIAFCTLGEAPHFGGTWETDVHLDTVKVSGQVLGMHDFLMDETRKYLCGLVNPMTGLKAMEL